MIKSVKAKQSNACINEDTMALLKEIQHLLMIGIKQPTQNEVINAALQDYKVKIKKGEINEIVKK